MSDQENSASENESPVVSEDEGAVEEQESPKLEKRGRPKGSVKGTPKKNAKVEKRGRPKGSVKPAVPKAIKVPKVKKTPTPNTHPNFGTMIVAAVAASGEKKGTTLAAIKTYIRENYDGVDEKKMATFCKKNLMKQVALGTIKQTKGTTVLGRFKIADVETKKEKTKKGKHVAPTKYKLVVKHDSDSDEEDMVEDPDFKATYYARVVKGGESSKKYKKKNKKKIAATKLKAADEKAVDDEEAEPMDDEETEE